MFDSATAKQVYLKVLLHLATRQHTFDESQTTLLKVTRLQYEVASTHKEDVAEVASTLRINTNLRVAIPQHQLSDKHQVAAAWLVVWLRHLPKADQWETLHIKVPLT